MIKKILNSEITKSLSILILIISIVILSIATIYLKHMKIDLEERVTIAYEKLRTLQTINDEILTELSKCKLGGEYPHMKSKLKKE